MKSACFVFHLICVVLVLSRRVAWAILGKSSILIPTQRNRLAATATTHSAKVGSLTMLSLKCNRIHSIMVQWGSASGCKLKSSCQKLRDYSFSYYRKKLSNFIQNDDWKKDCNNYVAKRYMDPVERDVYFIDVQLQMDAKLWGEEFNRHNPPKKV